VKDHLGSGVGEQADQIRVHNVGGGQLEPGLLLCRVEVGHAAGAQVVDADDGVAVRQQAIYQRRPDETGGSGHQRAHRVTLPVTPDPYSRQE
jgi:hypothetical protein